MPTQNPVLQGWNPDPSICRVGKDYFLATSSFEFFPGIPIYHSTDLINWKLIGHALNRSSQLWMRSTTHGDGVYAPTIRYWKGRWYIACSCVTQRNGNIHGNTRGFIVSTDDIWDDTKWTEPTYIDMVGIDQDLFFDDDDKVYLCTARLNGGHRQLQGAKLSVYASQIDLNTGRCLSRPTLLCHSSQPGPISGIAEGPHIFKRNGFYYLFVAECGPFDNHQERVYRSTSPLGPYEDPGEGINPLLYQPGSKEIQRAGHADIVEGADGRWWAVFLGVRMKDGIATLGRETFMCSVEWTDEGWPTFNGGQEVGLTISQDLGEKKQEQWVEDWRTLSLGWYHLRTPVKQEYSLTARPGYLTLYGNMYTLSSKECPSMLLRKQPSVYGVWETVIEFEPDNEYEEAGTAVFLTNNSYVALVIRKKGEGREMIQRWFSDDDKTKELVQPLPPLGPVRLTIRAQPGEYSFAYEHNSSTTHLKILSNRYINRPNETTFTGTHFALFAQSVDGEPCFTPAVFGRTSFTPDL